MTTTKNKQKALYELKKKKPYVGVCLSLIISGLGQVYTKDAAKGIGFFIGTFVMWFLLLGWLVQIIAAVDAYTCVKNYNRVLALELGVEIED